MMDDSLCAIDIRASGGYWMLMRTSLLAAAWLSICLSPLSAAGDKRASELQAADDARIAAVKAADGAKLREILSDDLHYGHSSGGIDTKTSFIESLTSGRVKYAVYDNEERNFTFPAPGIALMSGKAHAKVETATGGMDSKIGYLAVWRQENGQWRFLAWQACRILSPK